MKQSMLLWVSGSRCAAAHTSLHGDAITLRTQSNHRNTRLATDYFLTDRCKTASSTLARPGKAAPSAPTPRSAVAAPPTRSAMGPLARPACPGRSRTRRRPPAWSAPLARSRRSGCARHVQPARSEQVVGASAVPQTRSQPMGRQGASVRLASTTLHTERCSVQIRVKPLINAG